MSILINIIIVIFLLYMNGFFVATEFAMVKVRKSRIETLIEEGNKKAIYVKKVIDNLNSYLSACQLGITLASLGLGWIGEPAVSKIILPLLEGFDLSKATIHSISFIIGFAVITGLHIVLGELIPKSLAIITAEKIALSTAFTLIIFYKITYPIMWAFNSSTNFILKLFKITDIDEHDIAYDDKEIKILVEESYKHGLIDKTERTFVDNIFDFSETTVKDIMIPRTDMKCIFLEDPLNEILESISEEHLTRYPVCKENKDNIIGFIHIKDLYNKHVKKEKIDLKSLLREIKFVPESMSISKMLKIFQKEKKQLAIIIDEFGGTTGLVTVEDILEEIVGEIQDEFDEEEEEILKNEDGSYIVYGKVSLEDINEILGTDIEDENIETIGGFIYSKLRSYPKEADEVRYKGYEFIVYECDKKRVSKVLIRKQE